MFDEMKRFQKEVNELFSRYWEVPETKEPSDKNKHLLLFRKPLVDLKEREGELVVKIEIPGIDKKDIKLDVKEDRVQVKVDKKDSIKVIKEDYHFRERTYKGFYRLIELPHPVIPEQTKAIYKEGVLEVVIPKGQKKTKKEIFIE